MIIAVIIVVVAVFLIIVAKKSPDFSISREVRIEAAAATIFPHLNASRAMAAWSPWFKVEPPPALTFSGPFEGIGSICTWAGKKSGAGSATITETVPNVRVVSRLDHVKPFAGTQISEFALKPDGQATILTWSASGETKFLPRMMCTLINKDMDKMVGGTFQKGLDDLKARIEGDKGG